MACIDVHSKENEYLAERLMSYSYLYILMNNIQKTMITGVLHQYLPNLSKVYE